MTNKELDEGLEKILKSRKMPEYKIDACKTELKSLFDKKHEAEQKDLEEDLIWLFKKISKKLNPPKA